MRLPNGADHVAQRSNDGIWTVELDVARRVGERFMPAVCRPADLFVLQQDPLGLHALTLRIDMAFSVSVELGAPAVSTTTGRLSSARNARVDEKISRTLFTSSTMAGSETGRYALETRCTTRGALAGSVLAGRSPKAPVRERLAPSEAGPVGGSIEAPDAASNRAT